MPVSLAHPQTKWGSMKARRSSFRVRCVKVIKISDKKNTRRPKMTISIKLANKPASRTVSNRKTINRTEKIKKLWNPRNSRTA